jgi:tripartite-type tricarboxylate transporter receptor subunit TctC
MQSYRILVRLALAAALAPCAAQICVAQDYPARTIRIIVSQAPGSSVDILGRLIAAKLTEAWGQQAVVENRPGANAIIGMELAAKSKPDGYTLAMVVPSAMTVNQYIYKKLPYDPLRDFAPVTQSTVITFVLVVNPSLPVKSVKELVALGKARPDQLSYSSAGIGNLSHLAAELFGLNAGLKAVHVPNKGDTPALLDVMTGQTAYMFSTMPIAVPHLQSGRLRLLAVCGTARTPGFPDVPTLGEAGLRNVVIQGWTGVAAPAGTPAAIIAKVQKEVARNLLMADVKEQLAKQGAEPVGSTPEEFSAFIHAEAEKWSQVITRAGLANTQ